MWIKRSHGKIFGAQLTAAERRAMEIEISKQIAEMDRQNMNAVDAAVLWELHAQLGFGPKRLRRFYDGFKPTYESLLEHYEMGDSDGTWLHIKKLKDIGVDIEAWNRESE